MNEIIKRLMMYSPIDMPPTIDSDEGVVQWLLELVEDLNGDVYQLKEEAILLERWFYYEED